MNEEFESLKNRISSADPAKDAALISESTVAAAPLGQKAKMPWTKRMRQLTLSGSLLASAGAFALVVSLALPQQPLIQMAAGGGNVRAMSTEAGPASDAAVGNKMAIWPSWIQYEYDWSALSDETGRGSVYQLVLEGDPQAFLRELASFFEISGEVREEEWSTPEYPTFAIGTQERQVAITWAGTGTFYFNSYDPNSYRCEKRMIEQENGDPYEVCEPIATPELIPSEAEVRSRALEIFNRFGLAVSAGDIRVDRSEWGASAAAALKVNGQDSALEWWVNFDGAGKLSNVYGHLAKPQSRGDFNTVSAKKAAERIKDGRWYGSPPSSVWNQQAATLGARTAVEPAVEPGTTDSSGDQSTEPPVEPKVEIVTLRLTGSTPQLLMIFDRAGGAWLVPGYLLKNDQGWFDPIISLEDGVIELPDPVQMGIMPIEENTDTKQP